MAWRSAREQAIEGGLRASASAFVAAADGRWHFELANGMRTSVTARLAGEWLEVTAPAPDGRSASSGDAWSLLRFNARLAGPGRLALARRDERPHLRAELFLDDTTDVAAQVAALCEETREALHALQVGSEATDWPRNTVKTEPGPPAHLAEWCADAGWPCSERSSGELAVTIGALPARVGLSAGGRLRAVVELADAAAYAPVCRHAAGLLLLRVSALVRSVKGIVDTSADGAETLGLAVVDQEVSSAAIDRALSALTVATALVARETNVLRHESIAREYLGINAVSCV